MGLLENMDFNKEPLIKLFDILTDIIQLKRQFTNKYYINKLPATFVLVTTSVTLDEIHLTQKFWVYGENWELKVYLSSEEQPVMKHLRLHI